MSAGVTIRGCFCAVEDGKGNIIPGDDVRKLLWRKENTDAALWALEHAAKIVENFDSKTGVYK